MKDDTPVEDDERDAERRQVPRRLRFEVLRRDDFTCRYCGASAPDVQLHVDHVIPVVLGGSSSPTNLVTACDGCNMGKASTTMDDSFVDEVDKTAELVARARDLAAKKRQAQIREQEALFDEFFKFWMDKVKVHPEEHWGYYGGSWDLSLEWACQHPRTQVGDATALPADWTASFDIVATSVCYGNRLADMYDGMGVCKRCAGSGDDPEDDGADCTRCKGAGHDTSKRFSYRLDLGRPPSPGSACPLKWGSEYRELHVRAMAEWERVLRPRTLEDPGGLLLLNTSNFVNGDLKLVTEWFVSTLCSRGWRLLGCFPVGTRRIGFGANRDLRDDFEMVTAARPPAGDPTLPLAP